MKAKNSVFILFVMLLGIMVPVVKAEDQKKDSAEIAPEIAVKVDETEDVDDIVPPPADASGENTQSLDETSAPDLSKAADAKPLEPAAVDTEEAAPAADAEAPEAAKAGEKGNVLEAYPPQVKLSQWGPEIRINVIPNPEMGAEELAAVQSVKLETEKGECLGLKTFQPEEKTREAEFMINPEILKVDAVKLTVSSKTSGQWVHVQSLKTEEGAGPEAGKADAAAPQAAKSGEEKPKKKGWLW